MPDSDRTRRRYSFPFSFLLVAAVLTAALALAGHAQGTHLWTQSRLDEFEKGTPQGVALSSDGHLREAPGFREALTSASTFVWSVAADKNGNAYLGTGSPATVLRVSPAEKLSLFLRPATLPCRCCGSGPTAPSMRRPCPAERFSPQARCNRQAGREQRNRRLRPRQSCG